MVAGWVISKLFFWRDRERKLCSFPEVFCLLQETFAAPNFVLRLDGEFALYAVKALPGRKKLGRWNERGRAIQLWWRREERGRGRVHGQQGHISEDFFLDFLKLGYRIFATVWPHPGPNAIFGIWQARKLHHWFKRREEIEGARIKGWKKWTACSPPFLLKSVIMASLKKGFKGTKTGW